MLFKYIGILLLVALCVAHNGRRGGSGRSSYGSRSSGCLKSNNHYHKEYHQQPRKKPVHYEEPPRKRVLSLVEDVVLTIIKPLCDKEPKKYEHKPEERKKERRKAYVEDTRGFSEEYDNFRQRPQRQRQRPRNTELRRSFIDDGFPDYSDEYDIPQQQPKRTNRDKFDNYKQRKAEKPTKEGKCIDCNQQRIREEKPNTPTNRIDRPDNTNRNPTKPQQKKERILDKSNKRPSRPDYYDDDFPDDDYPNDDFSQDRSNIRQPIQQPKQVYDQYEYYYYEDYKGFVF